jgi:L-lactate dehydrogenase complex protein LldG
MSSRAEILTRIRTALGGGQPTAAPASSSGTIRNADSPAASRPAPTPGTTRNADIKPPADPGPPASGGDAGRAYRTRADLSGGELLDLLAERLTDYQVTVRRTAPGQLGAVIAAALTERGARRVVVPPGLECPALPADVTAVADDGLSASALDELDGVITAAAVAIAETGTIVLDASPDQGRRAITLLPDYHLCIVRADQVVALVPEAIARLQAHPAHPGRPLTWISGPSATSDIELERVAGVHGPRTLEVILVDRA